jgi:hypothetical protein
MLFCKRNSHNSFVILLNLKYIFMLCLKAFKFLELPLRMLANCSGIYVSEHTEVKVTYDSNIRL